MLSLVDDILNILNQPGKAIGGTPPPLPQITDLSQLTSEAVLGSGDVGPSRAFSHQPASDCQLCQRETRGTVQITPVTFEPELPEEARGDQFETATPVRVGEVVGGEEEGAEKEEEEESVTPFDYGAIENAPEETPTEETPTRHIPRCSHGLGCWCRRGS
ncbi:hypothetical protein GBF38_000921 [Nibea albiflora]|nr:hypothetical protein GBF38_000921 [Nibea albiflora]